MTLHKKLNQKKQIRVIGFDDAPFPKNGHGKVNVSGIVCSNTRFEGMLWGEVDKDGFDATHKLSSMICNSKFHQQLDAVLLDGIAVAGFNIINLKEMHELTGLPSIAVMRRMPDLPSIYSALGNLNKSELRIKILEEAGEIHHLGGFFFQVIGCDAACAAEVLKAVTDNGKVPEPLRLAHLIGAAIMGGESSNRA